MATDEDYLYQKVRNLRDMRQREALARIASIPGTLKANMEGSAADGLAYQMQFRPGKSEPVDKLKLAELKKDYIDKLADLDKSLQEQRGGLAKEALTARTGDAIKAFTAVVGAVTSMYGSESSATAAVRSATTAATANLVAKQTGAVSELANAVSADPRTAAATFDAMQKRFIGEGGPAFDPSQPLEAQPEWWNMMNREYERAASLGESQKLAAMVALNAHAKQATGKDLEQLYSGPGGTASGWDGSPIPDGESRAVALKLAGETSRYAPRIERGITIVSEEIARINDEAVRSFSKGVAGPDEQKIIPLMKSMLAVWNGEGVDAKPLDDAIAKMEGTADPDGARDKILAALNELDAIADMPVPPVSAREALQQLYADPSFQAFKEKNGLQDNRMALKLLKEQQAEAQRAAKASDRKQIATLRQQGGPSFPESAREEAKQKEAAAPVVPGGSMTPKKPAAATPTGLSAPAAPVDTGADPSTGTAQPADGEVVSKVKTRLQNTFAKGGGLDQMKGTIDSWASVDPGMEPFWGQDKFSRARLKKVIGGQT